jgi:hypothetical protein
VRRVVVGLAHGGKKFKGEREKGKGERRGGGSPQA